MTKQVYADALIVPEPLPDPVPLPVPVSFPAVVPLPEPEPVGFDWLWVGVFTCGVVVWLGLVGGCVLHVPLLHPNWQSYAMFVVFPFSQYPSCKLQRGPEHSSTLV